MTLETYDYLKVVAEVTNGLAVLEAAVEQKPDIVCMDINMPKLNGILATRQLQLQCPDIKVIALSSNVDLYIVGKIIHAGAVAYVDKANAGTELKDAIVSIEKNELYLSPTLGVSNFEEMQQYIQFAALEEN